MKVVGLDLSLTNTGWATYDEHPGGVDGITVGSFGEQGHRTDTLVARERRLMRGVDELVGVSRYASLAVIEAHSFSGKGGSQHDRSGFWWLVVHELGGLGVPVLEVAPSSLKMYATGVGNASKDAMLLAAARRFPTVPLKNNDEADALGLMSIGIRMLDDRLVVDGELNTKQAQAFAKIRTTSIYE